MIKHYIFLLTALTYMGILQGQTILNRDPEIKHMVDEISAENIEKHILTG